MTADRPWADRRLPDGYRLEDGEDGAISAIRIVTPTGELSASGYAVETERAFVYDRIVTTSAHRRRGLGHVVMAMLARRRRRRDLPQLLAATEAGRMLYDSLGWITVSPYSTAGRAES